MTLEQHGDDVEEADRTQTVELATCHRENFKVKIAVLISVDPDDAHHGWYSQRQLC